MYEGRLRGRPKPSDDVELPLRGGLLYTSDAADDQGLV